mmetsp:Transcript_17322/g.19383  ORF Transcript_17322/g.19383 Transcript_17322/m.19383 type:complete len:215 (-) Transcript_17322:98-742(-)|eukprot:CAMPEP_0205829618 /NCGR_PEP_ID=MMETSP0206-20130828/38699_1 /ASSEMBLY_ACC=CAM_ASM_000279 /TAXON_ID=36767 /ORGANISM="Euplotes focardii, Strain TN1" /LENGTH=214 /DNA_ID=CAMNT_0053132497 /DNA_START=28 /DNA_END=672 /DNA_ORIENTATION=+
MADEGKVASKARTLKSRFATTTKDNIGQLERLNIACFPSVYFAPAMYKNSFKDPPVDSDITRLICHHDLCVGAVSSRLFTDPEEDDASAKKKRKNNALDEEVTLKRVQISSLAVLHAYRGYGLARKLMQGVLDDVEKREDIHEAFLLVPDGDKDAAVFLEKFGFENQGLVQGNLAEKASQFTARSGDDNVPHNLWSRSFDPARHDGEAAKGKAK